MGQDLVIRLEHYNNTIAITIFKKTVLNITCNIVYEYQWSAFVINDHVVYIIKISKMDTAWWIYVFYSNHFVPASKTTETRFNFKFCIEGQYRIPTVFSRLSPELYGKNGSTINV